MNVRELKPLTNLLNNPKRYLDTHFKLIFVYPILFTNGTQINANLVRDFVSHYYLKELVVANSLHILSNVRTVESNDVTQQVVNNALNQPAAVQQSYFTSRYEYQEVVNTVTETLLKYLQIDPLYSKFRPALHTIIVPENLITIPVIVGTKMLPMDLLLMCMFLLVAAVENITLDRSQNIDSIVQHLKKYLSDESFSSVVGKVVESLPDQNIKRVPRIVTRRLSVRERIERKWGSTVSSQRTTQPIEPEQVDIVIRQIFTTIDQFVVHWRMVLDDNLFRRKFGLSINPHSQLGTKIVTRTEAGIDRAVQNATRCLNSEIQGRFVDLEITIFNFFQPKFDPKDLAKIENDLNNEILSQFVSKYNDVIVKAIANGVSSLSHDTSSLVVIGRELLDEVKKDVEEFNKKFDRVFQHGITSNSQEDYDYAVQWLIPNFDSYLGFVRKGKAKYEQLLGSKIDKDLVEYLNNTVYQGIKAAVSTAVRNIYAGSTAGYVEYLQVSGTQLSNSELDKYLTPIIYDTIYYRYLLCLTQYIGDYLYKSEVEFQISSGEVTDFPNYTLVLPLEILEIIHSFLYIRDFRRLLRTGELAPLVKIQPLNMRYLKDVVNYLTQKLRIPNIFAVDNKSGKVYYKFMNQSEVNNVNIQTIENFVVSAKNI